jgi:hypothetical protein
MHWNDDRQAQLLSHLAGCGSVGRCTAVAEATAAPKLLTPLIVSNACVLAVIEQGDNVAMCRREAEDPQRLQAGCRRRANKADFRKGLGKLSQSRGCIGARDDQFDFIADALRRRGQDVGYESVMVTDRCDDDA